MNTSWPDRQQVLEMSSGFRASCVLGAAAELDLWTLIDEGSLTAEEVTEKVRGNLRAVTMLLDALAALRVLDKRDDRYSVPLPLREFLFATAAGTILPMLRHMANVLRGWSQLAWVAKAGVPAPRQGSILGPFADRASFVAAMHSVSGPLADDLIARLGPPRLSQLLDVGGASGTWTIAFLRAVPGSRATIFDLPDAIHQARERLAASEFSSRVALVPGDFYVDELPGGADYAWVSAIAHQHSREHNCALFAKVHAALTPGGRIGIRDIVMEPCRTRPLEGALFAINMLANTESGGTYTFAEFAEDLRATGFVEPVLRIKDDRMGSVVEARKPQSLIPNP